MRLFSVVHACMEKSDGCLMIMSNEEVPLLLPGKCNCNRERWRGGREGGRDGDGLCKDHGSVHGQS